MSEQVYFDADGVLVSNARVVSRGVLVPVGSITSVSVVDDRDTVTERVLMPGVAIMLCAGVLTAIAGHVCVGVIVAACCFVATLVVSLAYRPVCVALRTADGSEVLLARGMQRAQALRVAEAVGKAVAGG